MVRAFSTERNLTNLDRVSRRQHQQQPASQGSQPALEILDVSEDLDAVL